MNETRRILLDGAPVEMVLDGEMLLAQDGRRVKPDEAIHLPPSTPSKILCVHLNYQSRLDELKTDGPPAPHYFLKPPSALNSHRGVVIRPRGCRYLNYEGEVVIVICRRARNVPMTEALDYVLGYTLANDFALHDFRHADRGAMLRVKGADTLAPVGPGLVTDWTPGDQVLRTRVNGIIVQESSLRAMVFPVAYLIADLSRTMTLEPGDLIFTGTPANSRPVEPGDVVTVECDGLGTLENRIAEGEHDLLDEAGWMPESTDKALGVALGEQLRE
ncbi:fumarylacetoacetate hydrolase family protein [Streptomyces coffeae]|uniref:Fumarylacetoacetate hydrolase family protein n=1 Tax=Streptomyces coffeae TaxID=621382 RepID=A0ABS1NKC6_9ACTN|nr:fumarylacetoacetate hydrolase family protein [Streptomyces coffeae]MBL1100562.1 fumarylacetoacetate hydrolase family protein [Streptomyces coffeae]